METQGFKPLWPGWETVRLIGRGSYGAVYEIERDMLGEKEKAALKLITIPQSSSDIDELYGEGYDDESITSTFKEHLKSIVAEYSLMRKMNGSANVVNCDDVRYVQHDDGIGWDIYIKMELLTPLTKALGREVPDEQAIRIGEDICRALVLCKRHNIIHRDIKPANIFVSENGDYKLGDFGIAKTVEKTSGGTKIGTYEYMAPEVYHDRPYGSTVDVYSLGMVLYWLLNERRTPFLKLPPALPTNTEKEQARKRRFSGEELPSPAHGGEELKRIVLKACAYDPKDRYQSAEDMLRDLEALSAPAPAVRERREEPAPRPASRPAETAVSRSRIAQPPEDGTIGVSARTSAVYPPVGQTPDEEGTISVFRRTEPRPAEKKPADNSAARAAALEKKKQAAAAAAAQKSTPPSPAPAKEKKPKRTGLIFAVAALVVLAILLIPKGGGASSSEAKTKHYSYTNSELTIELNDEGKMESLFLKTKEGIEAHYHLQWDGDRIQILTSVDPDGKELVKHVFRYLDGSFSSDRIVSDIIESSYRVESGTEDYVTGAGEESGGSYIVSYAPKMDKVVYFNQRTAGEGSESLMIHGETSDYSGNFWIYVNSPFIDGRAYGRFSLQFNLDGTLKNCILLDPKVINLAETVYHSYDIGGNEK